MKKIIIIYGLPGSGKSTQAKLLCKKYGFYNFGMGDKLRAEIASGSKLGQNIKKTVASGLLVSDESIVQLLRNVKKEAQEKGIVFDGFPRIKKQAKILDQILTEINLELDKFIVLKISEKEIQKRINKRLASQERSDDKDQKIINQRLAIFNKESTSLMAYYQKKDKLLILDGEKSIKEINSIIIKSIQAKP